MSLILFSSGSLLQYDGNAKDKTRNFSKLQNISKYGEITAFDIGLDCLSFCIGFSSGTIIIIDRASSKLVKEFTCTHNKTSRINAVRNILFGKIPSNIKCEILVTNEGGSVEKIRHSKRNIISALKHRPILCSEDSVYKEITLSLPYTSLKNQRLALLVSTSDILILLLEKKKPSVIYKFERLAHFPEKTLPLGSFFSRLEPPLSLKEPMQQTPSLLLCWGNVLCTVCLVNKGSLTNPIETNSSMVSAQISTSTSVNKKFPFEISSFATIETPALFIKVLSDNVLATVVNSEGENFFIDIQSDFTKGFPLDYKVAACKAYRPRLYLQKLFDVEKTPGNYKRIATWNSEGGGIISETLCFLTEDTFKKVKFHDCKDFVLSVWERKYGLDLALKVCAALFDGSFVYIPSIERDFACRKKLMREFILGINAKYFNLKANAIEGQLEGLNVNTAIERRRSLLGGVMSVMVEFLLECEQDEYLFSNSFQKDFIDKAKQTDKEMLFAAIQPFVYLERIR